MKHQPLDDLEMVELIWAAYPERFKDESNEDWEAALQLAEEIDGFDDLADLLGRVVMLTIPAASSFTGDYYHTLGKVVKGGGSWNMVAAVKREATLNSSE